ncbi:hypothetical protein JAAARDRAFT_197574 [Jaapia argillacea MUCL 33604]|uniref:F-box domain-containing protein n=1 Tax=Jaapia argillacea MUCL 33604 TaxID=933084 RepID=A0A067PEX5_9AGAM|nr:hypothetical protein JAAARDRAFT_197574 [Jaapia argillacea MUCL 33604]
MSYSRVFTIAELCREICWYLHDDSKPSLANFAQTCRSFLEPALDVLWFKMFTMEPLLDLIPALEVSDQETEYGQTTFCYDILYPLEAEDWCRFDYYVHRIHILEFIHRGEIDCDIYARLSQYTTSPNLLPSLRSITWSHDCRHKSFASVSSEVSPFLTSGLQTLHIGNYFDDADHAFVEPAIQSEENQALLIFFHMLPRRCPALESLTLSGDLQNVSFSFLAKFQNLKVVSLRGLSTQIKDLSTTLEAMSVLPRLEKIRDFEIPGGPGVVSCTPGFPSLSHISTRYGNPTNLLAILRCISSPSLQSFTSLELAKGSNGDFLSCASLLVSKFSKTLQHVTIHSTHHYPVETVGLPIFETLSRGLPKLRTFGLTITVDLYHSGWPTMTDDQVERMTLAWPNMENLSLQHSISLQSLKSMTNAWPSISSLTFSTLCISTPDLQLPPPKPHTLHNLSVSKFRQSDPTAPPDDISKVIHSMFPKLEVGFLGRMGCEVMKGVVALQNGSAERLRKRRRDRVSLPTLLTLLRVFE